MFVSLDIEKIYPMVRFSVIKKEIKYYTENLPESKLKKIDNCLEMISFGMAFCLITFHGKYY